MEALPDNDQLILEQAARWFLWLRDNNANATEVEVFQRWCNSHRKHRRAYESIERLVQNYDGVDVLGLPWPSDLEVSLDQYDGSYALPLPVGKTPLHEELTEIHAKASGDFVLSKKRAKKPLQVSWPAMAASVAAIMLISGLLVPWAITWLMPNVDSVYVTGVGQQRIEQLEDGSTITLGGNSRLTVAFSPLQRRLVLESGEVYFEVAKNAERPFIVTVDAGEVKAVGTAFNINKRKQFVTVSVVEGIVDVSRSVEQKVEPNQAQQQAHVDLANERLLQGQEIEFDQQGAVWQTRTDINLERATAWRQGRLAFNNEKLDRVIEDVNRYSAQKLILGDRELGELRYTGTVFNANIDDWLQGLEQAFWVRVLKVDNNIVLLNNTLKKAS